MRYRGQLRKMKVEYINCVKYYLSLNKSFLDINALLGKTIRFKVIATQCILCLEKTDLYRQGVCRNCFFKSPQVGDWVLHPEKSKAHLGIKDRDLEYEKSVQIMPHIVYLAYSSHTKVGVTRLSQVPSRWIDQGAIGAVEILKTPNRYLAGRAEVELRKNFSDKTNYRKMLVSNIIKDDLLLKKEEALRYLTSELLQYLHPNNKIYEFKYPSIVKLFEVKQSISFLKLREFQGELIAIKGQYLLFRDGSVLNIRNQEGYIIELDIKNDKMTNILEKYIF